MNPPKVNAKVGLEIKESFIGGGSRRSLQAVGVEGKRDGLRIG